MTHTCPTALWIAHDGKRKQCPVCAKSWDCVVEKGLNPYWVPTIRAIHDTSQRKKKARKLRHEAQTVGGVR
jgi:hypothetical protein